jgi:radical SAM family protein/iron-sulfur cluster protein
LLNNSIGPPEFVELETSRYCNRRCLWCPNGANEARTVQELMPWVLFRKILADLASIDFKGWLALHNYNEPLANPRLFRELRLIRALLPSSRPSIFTNGDLLTQPFARKLSDAGVNYLRVMRYPTNKAYGRKPSGLGVSHWLQRNNLLEEYRIIETRQGIAAIGTIGKMNVEVITPDISTYNYRGGTTVLQLHAQRMAPCQMTTTSAAIDFRGNLKMCCNVYPEDPTHADYIIGCLAACSFKALWYSSDMKLLRDAHTRADWSPSPICSACRHVKI